MGVPEPTKAQIVQSPYAPILENDDWQKDVLNKISAEKWKQYLQEQDQNLNTVNKTTDLQSLTYQKILNQRLKVMRSSAQMILEETGSNALYLVIGFLHWADDGSEKSRQAP
ncbi:DUF4011 domain-containing protein [Cysteiniphilum halobium]|uniref:DUF4011 domain-containing protein n=1 Tax=Cysteiniphilum halobium TaxID=2219059 RepID=UPI003F8453E0